MRNLFNVSDEVIGVLINFTYFSSVFVDQRDSSYLIFNGFSIAKSVGRNVELYDRPNILFKGAQFASNFLYRGS